MALSGVAARVCNLRKCPVQLVSRASASINSPYLEESVPKPNHMPLTTRQKCVCGIASFSFKTLVFFEHSRPRYRAVHTGMSSLIPRNTGSPLDPPSLTLQRLTGSDEGIAVIGMNRSRVKNALNFDQLKKFLEVVGGLSYDDTARVVILKSLVEGVFSSGADLKERITLSDQQYRKWSLTIRAMTSLLNHLPAPTIAAIDGHALGGGLKLALACDLRVAVSNATMGLPETGHGIIPGAGGTQRLPRLIGVSRAKDLILTGRLVDGAEAHNIGLVNYVTEQTPSHNAAYNLATVVARQILTKGPVALRMAKMAINRGSEVDIDTGLSFEGAYYEQVMSTDDRNEGLKAFDEKRTPRFKGK